MSEELKGGVAEAGGMEEFKLLPDPEPNPSAGASERKPAEPALPAAPAVDDELWPNGRPADRNQNVGGKKEPKDDPTRLEYWQSQADKFKSQYEKLAVWEPVVKQLADKPELLDSLRAPVEPVVPVAPEVPTAKLEAPKPPTRPTKPTTFDPVAAMNDPESESFKFRVAQEDYRDQYLEYMERKEQFREAEAEHRQQEIAKQTKMTEAKNKAVTQLRTAYGFSDAEVADFFKAMDDPATMSLPNLVAFYKTTKKPNSREAAEAARRAEELRRRSDRTAIPAIPDGGFSETPSEDEETVFNRDLLRAGKVERQLI